MSDNSRRFLASLLGIHLNEEPPILQSLVPERIANEIMAGRLPSFRPSAIMLKKNETCHYMDKAALAVQKKERAYYSRRGGGRLKLSKNYTVLSGTSVTKPLEQSWYEFKEGVIFVTNRRIIFVAQEDGFEKQRKDLTAVIPYADAVTLQFKMQTLTIVMPSPDFLVRVLRLLN